MLPSTDALPCLDTIKGDGINNLVRVIEADISIGFLLFFFWGETRDPQLILEWQTSSLLDLLSHLHTKNDVKRGVKQIKTALQGLMIQFCHQD